MTTVTALAAAPVAEVWLIGAYTVHVVKITG